MVFAAMVFMLVLWRAWKMLAQRFANLEDRIRRLEFNMESAEQQLAHFEFAADLSMKSDARDDAVDGTAARATVLEEDSLEGITTLEENVGAVRFGLMEMGEFVRYNVLSVDQKRTMLTQERANFVIWQHRTNADTTDAAEITIPVQYRESAESAEEEAGTDDEVQNESPGACWRTCVQIRMQLLQTTDGQKPVRSSKRSCACWRRLVEMNRKVCQCE